MSPKEWWIPGSCKIKTPDFFQEMDASKLAPVRGYGRRTQRETGIPGTRERLMPGWLMGIAFTKELSGVMVGYLAQVISCRSVQSVPHFAHVSSHNAMAIVLVTCAG